jgi:GT2 family glycosyltransferase
MPPRGPIDVVMLTHNRGDYLQQTFSALRERTPEPVRLIVVDNASEPEVRNWLWERRDWFHRLVLNPKDEYIPGFQHGIDLTVSDPYIVADPDLIVPAMQPSWLARLLSLFDSNPDFGMIALDLDASNQPAHFTQEWVDAFRGNPRRVSEDLMEGNVGTHFAAIRRDALQEPFQSDFGACESVRRAGYRVGWTPAVKLWHLGWDDIERYPDYLAAKTRERGAGFADYGDPATLLNRRPPRLRELALAGPVFALTRAARVPDEAVLEVAWREPWVGAVCDDVVTIHSPGEGRLPVDDGAAAAVVLVDPPADSVSDIIDEACRVATTMVVVGAELKTVGGRAAAQLAPPGWSGFEHAGPGTRVVALAEEGDRSPEMKQRLGLSTVQDRDGWLALWAGGTFPPSHRRLFAFTADAPGKAPPVVQWEPERLDRWRPQATEPAEPEARRRSHFPLLRRLRR